MPDSPETTTRRRIEAGDKLLCDGWAFGCQTFQGYPCVATEAERMVCGRPHAAAKDHLGVSHLYPVEQFRHAE